MHLKHGKSKQKNRYVQKIKRKSCSIFLPIIMKFATYIILKPMHMHVRTGERLISIKIQVNNCRSKILSSNAHKQISSIRARVYSEYKLKAPVMLLYFSTAKKLKAAGNIVPQNNVPTFMIRPANPSL